MRRVLMLLAFAPALAACEALVIASNVVPAVSAAAAQERAR